MIRQTLSRNSAFTALVWCWMVSLASAAPRRQAETAGPESDVAQRQPELPVLLSVPSTIAFQGFLTDSGGSPVNGSVELALALYDVDSGGTAEWSETQTGVSVTDGVFNVAIGAVDPLTLDLFDGNALWLEVSVGGETQLPRTQLQTSPFAFRAAVAESVDVIGLDDLVDVDLSGVMLDDVLQFDGSNWVPGTVAGGGPDGDWTISDPDIYSTLSGNVGIGTSTPSHKLHIVGDLRASKATIGTGLSNAGDFSTIASGVADTIGTGTSMFIGGGEGNVVLDGSHWSGIVAGRDNKITQRWSFVGAGQSNSAHIYAGIGAGTGNRAGGNNSFIGAGVDNLAGERAFVGGGERDTASGSHTVVGGGLNNKASHNWSTIGGGANNRTVAPYATVPGGRGNWASGQASLAAGTGARAEHNGSFVWADFDTTTSFSSTLENQFLIRASGGVGIGTDLPTEQLDVAGAIKLGDTNTGGEAGVLRWNDAASEFQGHDGNRWVALNSDSSDADWTVSGNDMYSNPTGNVGIGTASPGHKLHVKGTGQNDAKIRIEGEGGLGDATLNLWYSGLQKGVLGWDQDVNKLKLVYGTTLAGAQGIVVDSVGAVGIGVESPQERLDVAGSISTTGNVSVGGDVTADGNLTLGGGPLDDDLIYFDYGTVEHIGWDDSQTQFEVTDELTIAGPIQTGTTGFSTNYNRFGAELASYLDDVNDVFVSNELEVDSTLYANDNIYVGFDDSGDDDTIYFDGVSFHRRLTWDESESQFEFSDQLAVAGPIQAGNDGGSTDYNRFGSGTSTYFMVGGDANDVLVSDDLEVSGSLFADGTANVGGLLYVSGELHGRSGLWVGINEFANDDHIYMDDGTESVKWDNAEDRFEMTNGLAVEGPLQAGYQGSSVSHNQFGGGSKSQFQVSDSNDVFVSDDLEVDGTLYVDGALKVGFGSPIIEMESNTWGPEDCACGPLGAPYLVQTIAIYIDIFWATDGTQVFVTAHERPHGSPLGSGGAKLEVLDAYVQDDGANAQLVVRFHCFDYDGSIEMYFDYLLMKT